MSSRKGEPKTAVLWHVARAGDTPRRRNRREALYVKCPVIVCHIVSIPPRVAVT